MLAGDARSAAVNRRADAVHGEYLSAARQLDRKHHKTPPGQLGPAEKILAEYPRVRGLVFGAYSEASPDVEALLQEMARRAATNNWMALGARSMKEARQYYVTVYRRRWGCAFGRENAILLLDRLHDMQCPTPQGRSAQERQRAEEMHPHARASFDHHRQGHFGYGGGPRSGARGGD